MVGMTGFEPATSSTRTRRATKLRYIPLMLYKFSKDYPWPPSRRDGRIGRQILASIPETARKNTSSLIAQDHLRSLEINQDEPRPLGIPYIAYYQRIAGGLNVCCNEEVPTHSAHWYYLADAGRPVKSFRSMMAGATSGSFTPTSRAITIAVASTMPGEFMAP